MKQKLFLLFSLLLSYMGAVAQNTLSVGHIETTMNGSEKTILVPVSMDNADEVVALEFQIMLPEDTRIETEQCVLNSDRSAGHLLSVVEKGWNDLAKRNFFKVTAYSAQNKPFTGNEGQILTLALRVPSYWQMGIEYPIQLSKVVLSDKRGKNVKTGSEDGSILVVDGEYCDLEVRNVGINNLYPEGELTVTWSVVNIGAFASNDAGWTEKIVLTDNNGGSYVIPETPSYSGNVPVGEEVERSLTYNLPKVLGINGEVNVTVQLTADDKLNELASDKQNNTTQRGSWYLSRKIYLELPAEPIAEGGELTATLKRSGNRSEAEAFALTANPASRVVVPATVTIPAGKSETTFKINAVDDKVFYDGAVELRVEKEGYGTLWANINIEDDDTNSFNAYLSDDWITEGDVVTMYVGVNEPLDKDLTFNIACNVSGRFTFDKSIVLNAGETKKEVALASVKDNAITGTQEVSFAISSEGYSDRILKLNLNDDDICDFNFAIDQDRVSENAGEQAVMATITRENASAKVTFKVWDSSWVGSNNEYALIMPATVTMDAGQTTTQFAIGVKDNNYSNGTRGHNIYAAIQSPDGNLHNERGVYLTVIDDEQNTLTLTAEKNVVAPGKSISLTVTHNNDKLESNLPFTVSVIEGEKYVEMDDTEYVIAQTANSTTFNVKAKDSLEEGNYKVRVLVESDGYEYGEFCFTITSNDAPDLVAGLLTAPEQVEVGNEAELTLSIKNVGTKESASDLKVEILASSKATYDASVVTVLGTFDLGSVAADAETSLPCKVTMPATVGTVYLFARIAEEAVDAITTNNISKAVAVSVVAPFTVAVELSKTEVAGGDVVTINGTTTPAAMQQQVNLYYTYGGETYPLKNITTDAEGSFTTTWTAPAGQPGQYGIGGSFKEASSPDNIVKVDVIGLVAQTTEEDGNFIYGEAEPGKTVEAYLTLKNPGKKAACDLQFTLTGMPEGWTYEMPNAPTSIAAGKSVTVVVNVTPGAVMVGKQTIGLQVPSGDMLLLNLKGQVGCVAPQAMIVADVAEIKSNVTKGTTRDFSIKLTNTGNDNTGKVSFVLADGITLANAVGTIAKDGEETVVLSLAPQGEAGTEQNGQIVINTENGNSIVLPFFIKVVASAKGDVEFDVCDEFTYSDSNKPKVQDATITLTPAAGGQSTTIVMLEGKYAANVDEGYYNFTVTAPGHDDYKGNVLVAPEDNTLRTVNISLCDDIRIDYKIEETEELDGYQIVTNATVQTQLPVPQVTISVPGRIKCDDLQQGESMVAQVTVVNQGLITAKDLTVSLPQTAGWTWEAVSPLTFDLRPQESNFVNVRITRSTTNLGREDDCNVDFTATYSWNCGDEVKNRSVWATSVIKNDCKPTLPAYCNVTLPLVDENGTVVASVKMQFDQTMVLTRQAFKGTLTIENNSDENLSDITLDLTEIDQNGKLATIHEFDITYETGEGFEGDSNNWTLAAGKTGVAFVKYLPTQYAAPIVPMNYTFGGTISFKKGDNTRVQSLTDQTMTVNPSPVLDLTVFLQCNLYADDATTTSYIEPTEEGEFALLINNVGYGDANNVKLYTPMPELVENASGMKIDLSIVSSKLNGIDKSITLGNKNILSDFGTIPARSQAYAQWGLVSSLKATIKEYSTEVVQITDSENPDISLIGNVKTLYLLHSTSIGDKTAFVVEGDDADTYKLYFTDGSVEDVHVATMDEGIVNPDNAGWNLIAVECPGIVTNVASDGKDVAFWQSNGKLYIIDNIDEATEYTIDSKDAPAVVLAVDKVMVDDVEYTGSLETLNEEVKAVVVELNTEASEETVAAAITLTVQGEKVSLDGAISTTGKTITIDLTQIGHSDGYYNLTVNTAKLMDSEGNVGEESKTIGWVESTGKPVQLVLAYSHAGAGTVLVNGEEPKESYPYGSVLTLTVTPAEGYDFNRWSQNGTVLSTEAEYTYTLTAAKEIKLFFALKRMSIKMLVKSLDAEGNPVESECGTIEGGASASYEYGEEISLTAVPASGYVFAGWFNEGTDAPQAVKARVNARANEPELLSLNATMKYVVKSESTIYPLFVADEKLAKGDVNADGDVDTQDAMLVVAFYLNGVRTGIKNIVAADVNGDGEIDVQDAQMIVNLYLNK